MFEWLREWVSVVSGVPETVLEPPLCVLVSVPLEMVTMCDGRLAVTVRVTVCVAVTVASSVHVAAVRVVLLVSSPVPV